MTYSGPGLIGKLAVFIDQCNRLKQTLPNHSLLPTVAHQYAHLLILLESSVECFQIPVSSMFLSFYH